MHFECGPQRITCVYCKKEFGGDIFLDADVGYIWRSLVCCPYCDCLFLHIFDSQKSKYFSKPIKKFHDNLLNLFLKIIFRRQK